MNVNHISSASRRRPCYPQFSRQSSEFTRNAMVNKTKLSQIPTSEVTRSGLWLVKSEPDEFSFEHLLAKPERTGHWDARNNMRAMQLGDQVLFYHSSCKVPGVVGITQVVREAYPDHTAWDPTSKYHDPKSNQEDPKWWMVDLKAVRKLRRTVTLQELKHHKEGALQGMKLLCQPRLSVQPVSQQHWDFIMALEGKGEGEGEVVGGSKDECVVVDGGKGEGEGDRGRDRTATGRPLKRRKA